MRYSMTLFFIKNLMLVRDGNSRERANILQYFKVWEIWNTL